MIEPMPIFGKKVKAILIVSLAAIALGATAVHAQTNVIVNFTNKNGVVNGAMIVRIQGDKAVYRLEGGGGGVVPIADLPEYWRVRFATNAPSESVTDTQTVASQPLKLIFEPEKLWVPTTEQKKLEGSLFFKTVVDEFDRKVRHMVVNVESLQELSFYTVIEREYAPGEKSDYYCVVALRLPASEADYTFDESKPLQMIVNGTRFTVADKASFTKRKADWSDLKCSESYYCSTPETLIRSLGEARRAAVRVPCLHGGYTHDYMSVELQRFAIFCAAFMPNESDPIRLDKTVAPPTTENNFRLRRGGDTSPYLCMWKLRFCDWSEGIRLECYFRVHQSISSRPVRFGYERGTHSFKRLKLAEKRWHCSWRVVPKGGPCSSGIR